MNKFIIKSTHRQSFFIAIHGFTPMFGPAEKARKFDTTAQADRYAMDELFTTPDAFTIEDIKEVEMINDWRPETQALICCLERHGAMVIRGSNGEDSFQRAQFANDEAFLEELLACDEAYLYVRIPGREKLATIYLVLGNSPGELMSDYTDCEVLNAVCDEHNEAWSDKAQPKRPSPYSDIHEANVAGAEFTQTAAGRLWVAKSSEHNVLCSPRNTQHEAAVAYLQQRGLRALVTDGVCTVVSPDDNDTHNEAVAAARR